MANIDIFNLDNSGSELFDDSENFLTELNEQESTDVVGGWTYGYYGYYNYQNSVISQNGNTVNANSFGNVNTNAQF